MSDEIEGGMFALADPDNRIIRGLLLPYGELSRPSVSGSEPVMFSAGDVEIPADPSVATLNREHNRFDPLGRALELEERPAGVLAAFRVAETPEGDAYLAEYADGRRRKLSAEIAYYRDAAGAVVRRVLTGAAVTTAGAFAGAHLFAVLDVDADELTDELEPAADAADPAADAADVPALDAVLEAVAAELAAGDVAGARASIAGALGAISAALDELDELDAETPQTEPAPADPTEPNETETPMGTATAPASLTPGTPPAEPDKLTKGDLFAAIVDSKEHGTPIDASFAAGAQTFPGGGEMFALGAATGNLGNVIAPQFVGEVWSGGDYTPRWLDLFATGELTSLRVDGYRFVQRPTVASYAGDGAPVGGSAVTTEPVTDTAQRFAGGNVIPREYYDFNAREFVEAWAKYARDDYARKADGYVRTAALAAATPLDSNIPAGGEPSLPVIRRIIDGVFAIRRDPINARATFAMLPEADYKLLLHTGHSDLLEYLALALNVDSGSALGFHLGWDESLAAGHVIVGAKQSAKVRQLPGSPIRINAANVASGSFDEALFGYVHFMDEFPDALVDVSDLP